MNLPSVTNGNGKKSVSEILSQALSGDTKTIGSLISIVRAAAISEIGKPLEGASADEMKVYEANVKHAVSIALARLQSRSSLAFRQVAWEMYQTGEWLDVRLPIVDPVTKDLIRDADGMLQFEKFTDYAEWFWRVADDANLDRTIASVTSSCIIRLLPAVNTGKILNKNGKAITVNDVMALERSKLEVVTGPINKLLDDYQSNSNPLKLKEIGGIIENAGTMTRDELKKSLSKSGHRGSRVNQMQCYRSDLPDATAAYTIIANASQQRFLEGILSGRLNINPVELRELEGLVSRSFGVLPDSEDADDTGDADEIDTNEYDLTTGEITTKGDAPEK